MNLWEYIGNLQKSMGNNVKSSSVPATNGRIPFGVSLDTSKSIPNKDGSRVIQSRFAPTRPITNQDIENSRVNLIKGVAAVSGFFGSAIDKVIPESVQKKVSEVTEKPINLLMAGQRNVRSNYSFFRGAAEDNVAKGMLTALNFIASGLAGATAGAGIGAAAGAPFGGVGAAPGAIAGGIAGFVVGAGLGGAQQRDIAKSGVLGREQKQAALYAETAVGQEHYNFGRDATVQLARIQGFKSLGDTSMGIGAITSGLLNFGFEIAADPLLKGTSVAGKTAGSLLKGGVVPKTEGLLADALGRATGLRELELADRAEADVDLLKKTGAGEKTIYTDLFNFFKNNDAATIRNHPTLKNNDMGAVASSLLAGQSDEVISLVLRIGRDDPTALDELLNNPKYADTLAEFDRYESGIIALERDGMMWFNHDNSVMMLGNKYLDGADLIKAEYAALGAKKEFLQKATDLQGWLQTDRTVSPFAWVERQRNDRAVRATALGLSGEKLGFNPLKWSEKDMSNSELIHGIRQETGSGKVITSLYKNSMFSTPMQLVHRALDDAPHLTIKFDEGVQSATRMRTSLRDAVRYNVIDETKALQIFNDFLAAPNETAKYQLVEKYAEMVIRNEAIKNGHHESVADLAVNSYLKNHRLTKNEAADAKSKGMAFMVGLDGKAIQDPQLITQLANGAYLPDIPTISNAFKEFRKDVPAAVKGAKATAYSSKVVLDELQSVWRGGTLARGGFPMNILRDANFRAWADASLFSLYAQLTTDTLQSMTNGLNSINKISALEKDILSPKRTLKKIRNRVDENTRIVKVLEGELEAEGFYKKPKKGAPKVELLPSVARVVENRDKIIAETVELRRQEQAILSSPAGKPSKVIARNKVIQPGWDFPDAVSGEGLAAISRQNLQGRDNLRGAVASVRELQMDAVRRDGYGLKVIQAAENETEHLAAWTEMLTKHLANDPLSVKIMEGKMSKPELMNWLREDGQRQYIERFGLTIVEEGKPARPLRRDDAEYIYERVNYAVESLASDAQIRKLTLAGNLTPADLVKIYPNVNERPPVTGDVILAALGTSNIYRRFTNLQKDVVTFLATAPTSKLLYNPYFAVKYYEKLETLVMNANQRGILPDDKNKLRYEKIARAYAMNEYRSKINAFSKDMNFAGLMNYVIAFFPAVVEQFKSYGRIMLDNPELPIRLSYASQIPEYIGNVQEDSYGNKYIEYTMPVTGLKARFDIKWFNPINPTSGSILSAGPLATTITNMAAKNNEFAETKLGQFLLPFGVSTNNASAFTPNTWKKVADLWAAQNIPLIGKQRGGEQLNRDKDMISKQYLYDFIVENDGKQPNESELNQITTRAENDAYGLSVLRVMAAFTLPSQPKMRTAISYYQDRFNEAIKNDEENGAENFFKENPDYFMFAAKLNNPVSGINSTATALELLKRNSFATKEIVAAVGNQDLSALGAVFNDDNYVFSGSAEAYLRTQNIPGLQTKFKESEASLLNIKSAVVNEGWSQWYKLIQVVSTEIQKPPYNLDPARGLGETYLKAYKDAFIEQQKTENPIWYDVKTSSSGGGANGKMASVIKAVTIAANTPEMWKDLSQQPRWFAIAEYMTFRFKIYDELERRGIGYGTADAIDLRNEVNQKVWDLRRKDVKFGQFYDRYFDGDDFSYVFDYESPKRSK
jgi:hypothetical protein